MSIKFDGFLLLLFKFNITLSLYKNVLVINNVFVISFYIITTEYMVFLLKKKIFIGKGKCGYAVKSKVFKQSDLILYYRSAKAKKWLCNLTKLRMFLTFKIFLIAYIRVNVFFISNTRMSYFIKATLKQVRYSWWLVKSFEWYQKNKISKCKTFLRRM